MIHQAPMDELVVSVGLAVLMVVKAVVVSFLSMGPQEMGPAAAAAVRRMTATHMEEAEDFLVAVDPDRQRMMEQVASPMAQGHCSPLSAVLEEVVGITVIRAVAVAAALF